MTAPNIERAKGLIAIGLYVFPVHVTPDPENPFKTQKRPAIPTAHGKDDKTVCTGQCGKVGHGFYDASNDPFYIEDLFAKYPKAEVGVWMGPSGLNAADFDVKRSPEGEILVDGFAEFETQWLDLPDSWAFDSISGAGGRQYIYLAPEGVRLGPATNYRGIKGVDRRAGDSYSVWAGPVPTSRDVFSPAPEWLNDPSTAREVQEYPGTVKDWIESLEQGEPSVIVRAAMDRAKATFSGAGEDFSHGDMVSATYEAIRLGSEGQTGVRQLIDFLEDLFLSRTGEHSRGEQDWPAEFNEALVSGIQKYGAVTELRASLVPYDLSITPAGVPDRLLVGAPGNSDTFRELLAELIRSTDDDMLVTSILWGAPRTKDISREWGLAFVHERVLTARSKPEPIRENPSLEKKPTATPVKTGSILTDEERQSVSQTTTFIDRYQAASALKGFANKAYDVPAAWTALSMTFGARAYVPYMGALGVNLWFVQMGETGTGKTRSKKFLQAILDLLLRDGDTYYNVGASSSPAAIHEELLMRDKKPSMVLHDEAATFFSDLNNSEWMKSLEHHFSLFYDGEVEPSNKIRLHKDLRGKSAVTSFNINMMATPDKLLSLIHTDMFDTGFLSRVNWTWAPTPTETKERFNIKFSDVDVNVRAHPVTYDLVSDLTHAQTHIPDLVTMTATDGAREIISRAFEQFDAMIQARENYRILRGPLVRISETMLKCAALTALYRGDVEIEESDAVAAVMYAEEWMDNLIRVVDSTSESEFSRDLLEIEAYVKAEGGTVSQAKLNHRFRNLIRRSPRELEDRIQFLVSSGRLNRDEKDRRVQYMLNGSVE